MLRHEGGENQEELRRQERTKAWNERLETIGRIRDALGFPVDETIREPVAALHCFGIPTSASCEGHLDRGKAAPWIKIEGPNQPRDRFTGQSAIFAATAEKYHISEDDVRTARSWEAWKEATGLAAVNEETSDYHIWRKENEALQVKLAALLAEFYRDRVASPSLHLEIEPDPEGTARLHNGGDDYKVRHLSLSEDERQDLAGRLVEYQTEMKEFADFLKEKYVSSQDVETAVE